jgi:hypothetical protein
MLMRSARLLVALTLVFASCGGNTSTTTGPQDGGAPKDGSSDATVNANANDGSVPGDGSVVGEASSTNDGSSCAIDSASDLPGVTIVFAPQNCTFTLAQAAAGISIAYDVVVAQDVPGVIPAGQSSAPAPGPSGLIVFEKLGGGGQSYCLCDTGLGAQPSQTPVTIKKGTYPGTFTWQGKNWTGPSDFGNPMGAPFPAGDYRLDVSAIGNVVDGDAGADDAGADAGTRSFTVAAAFRITLVP